MKILITESQLKKVIDEIDFYSDDFERADYPERTLRTYVRKPDWKKYYKMPERYRASEENVMKNYEISKLKAKENSKLLGSLWRNKLKIEPYYDMAQESFNNIVVVLHDGNKKVLDIVLSPYMDGYEVYTIHGSKRISGQEIGLKLYERLVDYLKKPLYSGTNQTVYSRYGIWEKLIKKYPERVVGFDGESEGRLKNINGELYLGDCPVYIEKGDESYGENCNSTRLKLNP